MPDDSPLHTAIRLALRGLRFGHVQLVVHDGQVVRVERLERIRMESPTAAAEELSTHLPDTHST